MDTNKEIILATLIGIILLSGIYWLDQRYDFYGKMVGEEIRIDIEINKSHVSFTGEDTNLLRFSNETPPILIEFYGNDSEGKTYESFLVNLDVQNQVPCPQRFEGIYTLAYCFEIKDSQSGEEVNDG